jgi:hypothetical protein
MYSITVCTEKNVLLNTTTKTTIKPLIPNKLGQARNETQSGIPKECTGKY